MQNENETTEYCDSNSCIDFSRKLDRIHEEFDRRMDRLERQNRKDNRLRLYLLCGLAFGILSINFNISSNPATGTSFEIGRKDSDSFNNLLTEVIKYVIAGGLLGSGGLGALEVFKKVESDKKEDK